MKKVFLCVAVLLVGSGGMMGCGDSGNTSVTDGVAVDELEAYKAERLAESLEDEGEMGKDE